MTDSSRTGTAMRRVGGLAGLLGCVLATGAHALPLHVEAGYNVPRLGATAPPAFGDAGATPVSPPQDSSTSVDISNFFNVGNVALGVHTYGSIGAFTEFGNRVSGDFTGVGSYDIDGLFRLELPDAEVGNSFTFNIIAGEVFANGSSSFTGSDFVSAAVEFLITVGGNPVFSSRATASNIGGVTSFSTTGEDIGYSCSTLGGFAGCTIAGGDFTLDLANITGDLVYTLFAEAHGEISQLYSDCSTGGGGGEERGDEEAFAFFALEANGGPCGSIARSGDPLPEPASLALAGLGIGLLGLARRRPGTARRG